MHSHKIRTHTLTHAHTPTHPVGGRAGGFGYLGLIKSVWWGRLGGGGEGKSVSECQVRERAREREGDGERDGKIMTQQLVRQNINVANYKKTDGGNRQSDR